MNITFLRKKKHSLFFPFNKHSLRTQLTLLAIVLILCQTHMNFFEPFIKKKKRKEEDSFRLSNTSCFNYVNVYYVMLWALGLIALLV